MPDWIKIRTLFWLLPETFKSVLKVKHETMIIKRCAG